MRRQRRIVIILAAPLLGAALAGSMTARALAQVPVIDSSSSDAPPPAPAPAPAPATPPASPDVARPAGSPTPSTPAPDTAVESSKQTAGVDGKGVGLGISGERVVKLHDPTNHFWQFAIDGGFMYGTSIGSSTTGVSIYGGGADLNVQYRVGGDMPGTGGGSWSAFGFDLSGGIFGAAAVVTTPATAYSAQDTQASGFLLISGDVAAGYQFMTFGKMNDDDLKQHGFGLFLAGKVGVANTQVFASQGSQGSSNTNAQYGPEIQLTFPEYNFGTTNRAAFYISGFLLPTGDFLFLNIQLGGSFN
jgi:hypothetical protein